MLAVVTAILGALLALLRPRASLVLENLALRQQLAILHRKAARPRLRPVDRAFWAALSQAWSRWAEALLIVTPATVVSWHRRGFARFWVHTPRRVGRPPLDAGIVALIERMSSENPLWSRRRIASELEKLATTSTRIPWPGTCRARRDDRDNHLLRLGEPSSAPTGRVRSPSTSWWCRP